MKTPLDNFKNRYKNLYSGLVSSEKKVIGSMANNIRYALCFIIFYIRYLKHKTLINDYPDYYSYEY